MKRRHNLLSIICITVAALFAGAPVLAARHGRAVHRAAPKPVHFAPYHAGILTLGPAMPTPRAVDADDDEEAAPSGLAMMMVYGLYGIGGVIGIYTLRHYLFTLNRLFGRQKHPYTDVDTATWPTVTVFIAAHNEEQVIAHILEALLRVDYPADRMQILPVNDRSQDGTRDIIDGYIARFPGRITPFHRTGGTPGKAAALKDATELATGSIFLIFDADYVPSKGLIKQLVAPFFDVEVGAVMGRVVPLNVDRNLLTRMLDLERSGGYQVDQQARMNMNLVPQYGGTVGGVRRSALQSIGGWRENTLAEDTDLTFSLLLAGWKTVYQNRAECYEEVPETWPVRVRQIMRWAMGHNQAMVRYALPVLRTRRLRPMERLDGLLLLGIYAVSPLLMVGWALAAGLFYMSAAPSHSMLIVLSLASFGTLGNFAAYFEIAAATHLDGSRARIRLLPFNSFGFLVSMIAISTATVTQLSPRKKKGPLVWNKTPRFRKEPVL